MEVFNSGRWDEIRDIWNQRGLLEEEDAFYVARWLPDELDRLGREARLDPWGHWGLFERDLSMINSIYMNARQGLPAATALWPRRAGVIVTSIVGRLQSWIQRLFSAVQALALSLKANSFSIGVGAGGVSVAISFSV